MKYEIVNGFFHKGYVYLMSIVDGGVFLSTHKYNGSIEMSLLGLKALFQKQHDEQIISLIAEAVKNSHVEHEKYKEETVDFKYN